MSGYMDVVAHNILGMNANRQFGITTNKKAKSSEKLSSGYKINRAADDAAGLAISEKMRRQIRGLTQGTENTQDGISMCQIADGALAEVHEMLDRITELSVKAANGTNEEKDRQAIQEEISEILKEIDRVSETTTFNEQQIFAGSQNVEASSQNAQGTSNPPTLSFSGYQVSSDGTVCTVSTGSVAEENATYYKASTVSDIRQVGGTVTYTAKRTIYTSNKIINAGDVVSDKNELIGKNPYYARSNQTLTYNDVDNQGKSIRNLYLFNTDDCSLDTIATGRWVISGYGWDQEISDKHYFERIIGGGIPALGHQNIDVKTASPWVLVEPWGRVTESNVDQLLKQNINGGELVSDEETYLLNSENGSIKKIAAGEDLTGYVDSSGVGKGSYAVIQYPAVNLSEMGNLENQDKEEGVNLFWIQSGTESGDGMFLRFGKMDTGILGISALDVSTQTGASNAIDRSKTAIGILNGIRSEIGAQQNRLEHTLKHQNNTIENTTAAESRIRDTDMATEMVNFSKENILQQAGQTMLAQANQSRQGIMTLLQ